MNNVNDLKTIGSFEYSENECNFLGSGDYSCVYRAKKPNTKDTYAVKIFNKQSNQQNQEVEILTKLNHPNIPTLEEEDLNNNPPYLAMELIDGEPLNKAILRRERFTVEVIIGILKNLLEVIAYLEKSEVVHGDIKDDNIIVNYTLSSVNLIDFGSGTLLSTEDKTSKEQKLKPLPAIEYSPLSKIRRPNKPHYSHDVYAAGVVTYKLLMGYCPWPRPAELNEGNEAFEHLLLTEPLQSILVKHPKETDLWNILVEMLTQDDDKRPKAAAIIKQLSLIGNSSGVSDKKPRTFAKDELIATNVYRDPIHKNIFMTDYEWKIFNTKEFQRLGYIKQLGTTHYVYGSATHTRKCHSIGCLHVVDKIFDSIKRYKGDNIDVDIQRQARLYALLHDISHIAMGHTFEDELDLFERHDDNYQRLDRILYSPNPELVKILHQTDCGNSVLRLLEGTPKTKEDHLVKDIVSSFVGADVLDYIDRDAHFCGLTEAVDDIIYRYLSIDISHSRSKFDMEYDGKYGVRLDAANAVRRIFLSRHSLFEKVYTHKAKVAAGAMLGKAVYAAKTKTSTNGKPILTEADIEWMGDEELIVWLKNSSRATCRKLANLVYNRKFYKPIFQANLIPDNHRNFTKITDSLQTTFKILTPEGREGFERAIAKKIPTLHYDDVIVYATRKPPGYSNINLALSGVGGSLTKSDFEEISQRHIQLWKVYVFVNPEQIQFADKISHFAESYLNITNDLIDDNAIQQPLNLMF